MSARKHTPGTDYSNQNKVELIRGGKEYFDLLLHLITNATDSIHLQSYIYDDDETGRMIGEALIAAANRNVQVYVMADGYASQRMNKQFITHLQTNGIRFRFFEPLLRSKYFYFGRRMHHKVFVVDATHALVGGINIADRYNDVQGMPAWLDFALHVEGKTAQELCILCWKTWNGFPANMGITRCEEMQLQFQFSEYETSMVRMRRNDWVRSKNEISATYIDMFRNAQSHITIICSYFLPGKVIRRLLSSAARRGVSIKLITAGTSDIMLAKHAERWLYDWLLRNNIKLYEYQNTVLHAKLALCDGKFLTAGSYNINNISAYASIELNLDVKDDIVTASVEKFIDTIIETECVPVTKETHQHQKNNFIQFIRWCSYHIIRAVFYLFTFYYKRKKGKTAVSKTPYLFF
jgi:cardiolipin synthase A/B